MPSKRGAPLGDHGASQPKKKQKGGPSADVLARRQERARRFREQQRLKQQQDGGASSAPQPAGEPQTAANKQPAKLPGPKMKLSRRRFRGRGNGATRAKALSAFSGEDLAPTPRKRRRWQDLGAGESKGRPPSPLQGDSAVDPLDAYMADLSQSDDLRVQRRSDAALTWSYATQNPVAAAVSASTGDAQGASLPSAKASGAAAQSALASASVLPSQAQPAAELSAQQASAALPQAAPGAAEDGGISGPAEGELAREDRQFEADRREFRRAQQQQVLESQDSMDRMDAAASDGASLAEAPASEAKAAEHGAGAEADGDVAKPARAKVELGRLFESEGDVMDEEERRRQEESAFATMEAEAKKKEVKAIDHDEIEYLPFRKNLYIVPRALARLSQKEVQTRRDKMGIKVRGRACPPPVEKWSQCGLSDRLETLLQRQGWREPFSIQKQAVPAIMSGRDVIGVAKTGSGKTLAFLLPLYRHILDQIATHPLGEGEGPIGLILAPARELALQIAAEARKFARAFNLRVATVYGGGGVKEQIAQLKRGAEVVVCTPGRMIDILTMQAGRLVSFQRVSFVVMDEADRMFDMGFEPQIRMIIGQVRPDRQTLLFSATFPKSVERLAKQVLKFPLEITVGGRSVASDNIRQIVELHEEKDKFLRLLQLLGVWFERGSIIVFVQSQDRCDKLFQELVTKGYPCAAIHAAMDQADRDSTLQEFKKGENTLLIATAGVAGRGLDVPSVVMVVNYSCPNHLEDYVHRVGRTGRAGRSGTAYTFISSDEEQHAPTLVRALEQAGQDVPTELRDLAGKFDVKVQSGAAKRAKSGFGGKGFTFDDSEKTETQRLEDMRKRKTEIDMGLRDASDDRERQALEARLARGASDREDVMLPSATLAGAQQVVAQEPAPGTPGGASGPPPPPPSSLPSNGPPSIPDAIRRAQSAASGRSAAPGSGLAAGRAQALAIAQQFNMRLAAEKADRAPRRGPGQREHNTIELEINDFALEARQKALSRDFTEQIHDMFDVAIVVRGIYVASGRPPPEGQRALYIVIESPDRMQAEAAKKEILRVLAEETMRASVGGGNNSGRYSVI